MKTILNNLVKHPIISRYIKLIRVYIKAAARKLKKEFPAYSRNIFIRSSVIILTIIFLCVVCVFFQVGNRYDRTLYIVNIPKGYSASQVGDMLQSKGIIDGKYGFNLIVNIFRLQNRIQAGTYEFTPNMPLIRIINKIKKGEIIPPLLVKIVIPEGLSIYKIGQYMEKEGVGNGSAFKSVTQLDLSERTKNKYWFLNEIPIHSLEGYLFPDTYLVPSNLNSDQMADIMISRFNKKIAAYWKKNNKKMKVKMTFHQIITLASIIEKEAAIDGERPVISSVYHNRLRIRMHLGADPTIKYVLERPGKIVSLDDLKINSPYNTYRHYGLPPGPICNPGLLSVKAAMFPAKTDYLYFVARADGSHIFNKTLADHKISQEETRKERIKKIYKRPQY